MKFVKYTEEMRRKKYLHQDIKDMIGVYNHQVQDIQYWQLRVSF